MSNRNTISCRKVGDYNIPNLTLPPEEANIRLGKWGMLSEA
ncbi:MAG: TnpV protein [Clostridia bacterium]|nr:TnpV protein [Clostridia bacterium]